MLEIGRVKLGWEMCRHIVCTQGRIQHFEIGGENNKKSQKNKYSFSI